MLRRIALLAVFAFTLKTQFLPVNSAVFTPADSPGSRVLKPAWLADTVVEGETEKAGIARYVKPVLITAAAGGITYFLYAVRSR